MRCVTLALPLRAEGRAAGQAAPLGGRRASTVSVGGRVARARSRARPTSHALPPRRPNTLHKNLLIPPSPSGLFEIVDASPPPRSLGEHPLPPDTHNGDRIEAAGSAWVVQRTALHYRLVKGKYVKSAARVEVVNAGRFLVERYLDGLMDMSADGSGGGSGGEAGGGRR
jgi:hypothetical protein